MAVVLGRLLPGLRVLTAIACGIFRVPYRVFLPAMGLGSLIYIVGYTMLGYFAGPAVLGLFEALHLPIGLVGSGWPAAAPGGWADPGPARPAASRCRGQWYGPGSGSEWGSWLACWPVLAPCGRST